MLLLSCFHPFVRARRLLAAGATLLTAFTLAGACAAQSLVFVDADEFVNLAPSSAINVAGSSTPVDTDNDGIGEGDNKWGFRGNSTTPFGANGFIYEASAGTTPGSGTGGIEDVPEITQTISGLAPGSYDIYVSYWNAGAAQWNIRAGVGPGALTLFNQTGPQTDTTAADFPALQNAVAGVPARSALWASPPLDTNSEPIFAESNRVMLLGKIGTASPVGGQIVVRLDDLSTADFPGLTTSTYRTWLDGVAYAPAGTVIAPELFINRGTGEIQLQNNTGTNLNVVSYSLTSAAGGLNPAGWSPIDGNLDNGGGFDTDDWQINTQTTVELAEQETTIGNGGTFGSTPLSLGNAWTQTPFEDVQIVLTLADMSTLTLDPKYSGTPVVLGDFNGSGGNPNIADFAILMSNLHKTMVGTTKAESHLLGDLTGDLAINFDDYRAFRTLFEANNGAGSFTALLAGTSVPEPASVLLFALAGLGLITMTCFRRRLATCGALAAVAALVLFATSAPVHAQVTYVDASLANTDIAIGGPDSLWVDGNDGSTGGTVADGAANNDGLWRYRGGFHGGIFEATGSTATAEDAVEIVTTATGIASGFYKAYVFWHPVGAPNDNPADGTEEYPIRAGFSSNPGANQIFTQVNTPFVQGIVGREALDSPDQLTFSNPASVPTDSSTRPLLYGLVGFKEVTDGTLPIFIDDLPANPAPEGYPEAFSDLRPWYQGIGYELAVELTLEVDTTTGATKFINNQTGVDFDLSYYEIRSNSGSLNPTGWTSFSEAEDSAQHPAPDGAGWDEAGGSTANILSEGRLAGMDTFMPTDEASLGAAFTPGGSQDLRFFYAAPGGALSEGIVAYVASAGLTGDYNGDGRVDAADYTVWRDNLGGASLLNRDSNNTGPISAADYASWKANFGASGAASLAAGNPAAVPEPSSLLLAGLGLGLLGWRHRRRVA